MPTEAKSSVGSMWCFIDELWKRRLGYSSKFMNCEIFQRQYYGSLHCVERLGLVDELKEHTQSVSCLHFHPDGNWLVSCFKDVIIWDWRVRRSVLKYPPKHRAPLHQCKFINFSGERFIVTGDGDGQVRLMQITQEDIKNERLLGHHSGFCRSIHALPEQFHTVLSVGDDGVILNHDIRDSKSSKIGTVREKNTVIQLFSIQANPLNSEEFCVGGGDEIVRVYDRRRSHRPRSTYTPFKNDKLYAYDVTYAVYNHDGSQILASRGSDVYLFDVKQTKPGKFLHRYAGREIRLITNKGAFFFGPNSEFVVSASDCGYIFLWDTKSERLVRSLDPDGIINCIELHPRLPIMCSGGLKGDIHVWMPLYER